MVLLWCLGACVLRRRTMWCFLSPACESSGTKVKKKVIDRWDLGSWISDLDIARLLGLGLTWKTIGPILYVMYSTCRRHV